MASLLKRTVVLSFSRLANQAIVLLSPILLVRILSVQDYGGYREFMLYAGLVGSIVTLGIPQSLTYFVPKEPERERVWVSQATIFIFASSMIAVIAIFLLGDIIRANTSFDFVTALQLYILFATNFDFIEFYWLGKKRTDNVFYYSSGRLFVRIIVVITVAVLTKDAYSVVLGLIVIEGIRCLLVIIYGLVNNWFTTSLSGKTIRRQVGYFLPLGAGGLVEVLNVRIGMLFVSVVIGAEALAFYTIGSLATQIVNILRGAIADVIFPEIVELRHADPKQSLPLWKEATVWYCVLLFPVAVTFFLYSDVIVIILFTEDYAPAIPVFSAFAWMLLLYCFDFHLPLRVQNANRYFLQGSGIALLINAGLLYPMFNSFGLIGPVIAFLVTRVIFLIYLSHYASHVYATRLRDLVLWSKVGKVFLAAVLCAPILIIGEYLLENLFVRAVFFVPIYFLLFLVALRRLGVWDAFYAVQVFSRHAKQKRAK